MSIVEYLHGEIVFLFMICDLYTNCVHFSHRSDVYMRMLLYNVFKNTTTVGSFVLCIA